jgi:hypothetical protein
MGRRGGLRPRRRGGPHPRRRRIRPPRRRHEPPQRLGLRAAHRATGLNLTLAAGGQERDAGDDPYFGYAKLGWTGKTLFTDATSFSIDVYGGDSVSTGGSESVTVGLAAVQPVKTPPDRFLRHPALVRLRRLRGGLRGRNRLPHRRALQLLTGPGRRLHAARSAAACIRKAEISPSRSRAVATTRAAASALLSAAWALACEWPSTSPIARVRLSMLAA